MKHLIPLFIITFLVGCSSNTSPVDDGLVKKAYKVLDWIAFNVGKAKDK